ncbi:glutamine-dependent NAD(+) synthetase with GAT domain-containing protein [Didymella exigua CBS 183.55]|uniref:Glutamine-dependent NAD(+) synthetase n=1 Tax=Didymella exigua CBS 183.55 TaxID=1150837 RepID=A0A6A5R9W4_9PLEO|nr:glutamine-dependent NAD(+) synthetase with GAT domain-containing protein [Didymella exigua CBS 183.55]KAF1924532.1 glutamine-dependent NAD(+) synthetase with GAT domain-containing protein [Didymella exigua CBS 183.55]
MPLKRSFALNTTLDGEGNLARIKASIQEAKARGASLPVGSKLEICGYGCLDHFLEDGIYTNSWHMLLDILEDEACHAILLDIGMPVKHEQQRLNCRIIALDGNVILICPKLWLANEGNYHEARYFDAWSKPAYLEDYHLSPQVAAVLGSRTVPIGDAVISTRDAVIYCEDLLTPASHHDLLVKNGVDSVGKTADLLQGMQQSLRDNGGVIVYANQKGCDGDRFYYGGKAAVIVNGTIASQALQFSLNHVEVAVATINLSQARCYCDDIGRTDGMKHKGSAYRGVKIDFNLSKPMDGANGNGNGNGCYHTRQLLQTNGIEEELVLGPACWLWDTLRRSRAAGFLYPLSGGIDSCSTATLVYAMCRFVIAAVEEGNQQVPKFSIYGGSEAENLALHNIQARGRRVTAYYFAQTLPTIRQRQESGGLLVLGSVNLEECHRGNVTKHDCSSADLSVTGGTLKLDIRSFIRWAQTAFSLAILGDFLDALPTGELEPRQSSRVESNEKDMGMTYEEIFAMAKLRKVERMGPVTMFERLLVDWREEKTPQDIAVLVKRFHHFYAINRHKMTTMTPAYYAADYSAEDPRPFLYPDFQDGWACKRIDAILANIEGKSEKRKDSVLQP